MSINDEGIKMTDYTDPLRSYTNGEVPTKSNTTNDEVLPMSKPATDV